MEESTRHSVALARSRIPLRPAMDLLKTRRRDAFFQISSSPLRFDSSCFLLWLISALNPCDLFISQAPSSAVASCLSIPLFRQHYAIFAANYFYLADICDGYLEFLAQICNGQFCIRDIKKTIHVSAETNAIYSSYAILIIVICHGLHL